MDSIAENVDNFLGVLIWATPPIQQAYIISALGNAVLGVFECIVILQTRFVSTNTAICYLTGALAAMAQIMMD